MLEYVRVAAGNLFTVAKAKDDHHKFRVHCNSKVGETLGETISRLCRNWRAASETSCC